MPEILPAHVPSPRCVIGWDGTAYRAFAVDASGHIQTDVLTSALPAGAATAANQVTMITALQLIDDLRNALQSVAADRLKVRGEDQLFGFKGVLTVSLSAVPSGANGYLDSPAVPAGEIWVVTTLAAADYTRALTQIHMYNYHNAIAYNVDDVMRAIAAGEHTVWGGHTYLDAGDVIRVYFTGAQAADTVSVDVTGYRMTVEV